jgi:uncharacterized protein YndB with AHSA1/START domain
MRPAMRPGVLAAVLLFATCAAAGEPPATRTFEVSGVIPAPPAAVWQALTTADGWHRMGVPFAVLDFRVGGIIETNYQASAHLGQPDNIKNQVVAFLPGRMMAMRYVQAPPTFPYPKEFAATATVFELAASGKDATRLVVTGVGYGEGPAYDWLLDKFRDGDAWTLEQLRASFEGKPRAQARSAPSFTKPPTP